MPEQNDICSLCGKPNEQLLMLNCSHDPCIHCATKTFAEQVFVKGENKDVYICSICQEQTPLDKQTSKELTSMASRVVKSKSPNKDSSKISKTSKVNKPSVGHGNSSKKVRFLCKQHSEEQITYYCFNCEISICPQCAIHGNHMGHEVQLIKKAVSRVKEQYNSMEDSVYQAQNQTSKLKNNYYQFIKDMNNRMTIQRNFISQEFDNIRAALAVKEKVLFSQLEQINKQNMALLNSAIQTATALEDEGVHLQKVIETITRKQQVLILEESRRIGQLKASVNEFRDKITVSGSKTSHPNFEIFKLQCKQFTQKVNRIAFAMIKQSFKKDGKK